MPQIEFGKELSFSQNMFASLKDKNELMVIRLLDAPVYEGKHFLKTEFGEWNVIPCPRINAEAECETCEAYFGLMKEAVKSKEKDKEKYERVKKEAEKFKVTVNFYFPIIDRGSETLKIFKTTPGVRNKLNAKHEAGVKVFERDWTIMRTENPGSDYYTVDAVDSADSKKLTPKEKAEMEKYKKMNLNDYIMGTRDDESEIGIEANTVKVDEPDL